MGGPGPRGRGGAARVRASFGDACRGGARGRRRRRRRAVPGVGFGRGRGRVAERRPVAVERRRTRRRGAVRSRAASTDRSGPPRRRERDGRRARGVTEGRDRGARSREGSSIERTTPHPGPPRGPARRGQPPRTGGAGGRRRRARPSTRSPLRPRPPAPVRRPSPAPPATVRGRDPGRRRTHPPAPVRGLPADGRRSADWQVLHHTGARPDTETPGASWWQVLHHVGCARPGGPPRQPAATTRPGCA